MQAQSPSRKRIGELLIDAGIIRAEELPVGLKEAAERSLRLGEVLVMLRYLSAEDLEAVLQAQTRLAEGSVSERRAVAALSIASSYRTTFDNALSLVEKDPLEKRSEHLNSLKELQAQLAEAERIPGPSIAVVCQKIAEVLLELGDAGEAEAHYKRALQVQERWFGPRNLKIVPSVMRLADLYLSQNRAQEAETLYWRALDVTQTSCGVEHMDVARCQRSLARFLESQARFREAEQLYLSSLRIVERVGGQDCPEFTDNLRSLTRFWSKQGKRPERKRLGDLLIESGLLKSEQLQLGLQQVTTQGRPLGQALIKLNYIVDDDLRSALQAQLLVGDGVLPLELAVRALRLARPGKTLEEALSELGWDPDRFTTSELRVLLAAAEELMSAEVALGSQHAGVAVLSLKLADVYTGQMKFAEAEPLYLRAIEILERFFGPKDAEVATGLHKLAVLKLAANKPHEAEPLLWRALEIRRQATGTDDVLTVECLEALATVQVSQQNFEQAERLYQSCLSIRDNAAADRFCPKSLNILRHLAQIYSIQEKLAEAESAYLRLLKASEREHGSLHPELVPWLGKLGDVYLQQKQYDNASTQLELALEILERYDDRSAQHAELMEKYSLVLDRAGRAQESRKMADKAHSMKKNLS